MPLRKPVFVGAAAVGANAVDVAADLLIGARSSGARLPRGIFFVFFRRENLLVDRFFLAFCGQFVEISRDAIGMMQFVFFLLGFIVEGDLQTAVDVGNVFQMLPDGVGVEMHAGKDFFIGAKENNRVPSAAHTV